MKGSHSCDSALLREPPNYFTCNADLEYTPKLGVLTIALTMRMTIAALAVN